MTPKETDDLLQEARDRWDACNEAEQSQRTRIVTAKQFRTGDQWPGDIRMSRKGTPSAIQGMPPTPPRPCLTIDRLSQPVRQVSNMIKTANFAIDVLPNGFGANTDTAEMFKGYLRYVQNRSRGESPVEWAADQALEGGIGWFRVLTEYVYDNSDGVPPEAIADQTLVLGRIANNLTVYCDPWATKPTRSDARFMFVTEDMDRDEFRRRWPHADLASLEDFISTGDVSKDWIDNESVRIAEYWRVIYQEEHWAETAPNQWARVTERPKSNGHRTRTIQRPIVEGYKIIATEVLERWDWVGSHIPIIPILGEEYNVDGKVFVRGLIEPAMDAQRMVNYTYSGAIEIFALGSKAQFIAADDQVADYKQIWQTANLFNYSYLPYKAVQVAGTLLPPPQRDVSEAPIQAAAMLLQVSEEGIKATTGIYDPSLGQNNPQLTSGRMTQQLQGQADLTSSNYPDNVKRALIYAGELMVEIAPKITRVGQLLHILGKDDQPQEVLVGQHFQTQDGRAVPVNPQTANPDQGLVKFFDLTLGKYAVAVSVGKSFTTQREEGFAAMGQLMPALPPEMAAVTAPEFVAAMSFPGAQQIAEKMRRALPPALQDPDPKQQPNLQQQLQQAMQQIQQLTPLASKNAADLQGVQMRTQGDFQTKQMQEQSQTARDSAKLQAEERQHALDNLVKLAIAEIAAKSAEAKIDAEQARTELGFHETMHQKAQDLAHDAVQAHADRQHDLLMQARDQAHEAGQQAADRVHEAGQQASQQAADAAMAMQQQQADQQQADQSQGPAGA